MSGKKTNMSTQPQQTKPNPQSRRNRRNARRRIRSRRDRRIRLGIRRQPVPASYGWSGSSQANIVNRGGQAFILSREIFAVPYAENSVLDFMLPMNPAQWRGTRTAQLASTFAAYRPTALKISWMSTTGTSVAGTVAVGTVFAGTTLDCSDRGEATAILAATNGGFVSSLWKSQTTGVRLATSLRANNFPTTEIQMDDIPLWIVAAYNGAIISDGENAGYIVVNAKFSMYNPTMSGNYPASGSSIRATITHSDQQEGTPAASAIMVSTAAPISLPNLSENDDFFFAPGSRLLTTSNTIATKILQPIHAVYKGTSGEFYIFEIDPIFKAALGIVLTLIGKGTNFILTSSAL